MLASSTFLVQFKMIFKAFSAALENLMATLQIALIDLLTKLESLSVTYNSSSLRTASHDFLSQILAKISNF